MSLTIPEIYSTCSPNIFHILGKVAPPATTTGIPSNTQKPAATNDCSKQYNSALCNTNGNQIQSSPILHLANT